MPRLSWALLLALIIGIPQPAGAQDPGKYDDAMERGNAFLKRGADALALDAFKKAYSLSHKSSFDAALGMALSYRAMGKYGNMLDATTDAVKLAGPDLAKQAQAHNLRGVALVAQATKAGDKHLHEAEAEFRDVVEEDPTVETGRLNLGITLLKEDHDEEGVQELKTYVAHAPDGQEARYAERLIENPRLAWTAFAPEFNFVSRDGQSISLASLQGKIVLIDFWGSWCPPCQRSMPGLLALHKKFGDKPVVFLGIAHDKEWDWNVYLRKNPLPWAQFLDTSDAIVRQFGVTGYPTYVIIDANGIVSGRTMGYGGGQTDGWIARTISTLLKGQDKK